MAAVHGRPVFVIDRHSVEFWHEELVEWRHFVPVKRDLSDLLENYVKLEGDAALYAHISAGAREFATQTLFVKDQLRKCACVLTARRMKNVGVLSS